MQATPIFRNVSVLNAQYKGAAMSQLRILKQELAITGKVQGSRIVEIQEGVVVVCSICYNQESVVVHTGGPKKKEDVVAKLINPDGFIFVRLTNKNIIRLESVKKNGSTELKFVTRKTTKNYGNINWIGPEYSVKVPRTVLSWNGPIDRYSTEGDATTGFEYTIGTDDYNQINETGSGLTRIYGPLIFKSGRVISTAPMTNWENLDWIGDFAGYSCVLGAGVIENAYLPVGETVRERWMVIAVYSDYTAYPAFAPVVPGNKNDPDYLKNINIGLRMESSKKPSTGNYAIQFWACNEVNLAGNTVGFKEFYYSPWCQLGGEILLDYAKTGGLSPVLFSEDGTKFVINSINGQAQYYTGDVSLYVEDETMYVRGEPNSEFNALVHTVVTTAKAPESINVKVDTSYTMPGGVLTKHNTFVHDPLQTDYTRYVDYGGNELKKLDIKYEIAGVVDATYEGSTVTRTYTSAEIRQHRWDMKSVTSHPAEVYMDGVFSQGMFIETGWKDWPAHDTVIATVIATNYAAEFGHSPEYFAFSHFDNLGNHVSDYGNYNNAVRYVCPGEHQYMISPSIGGIATFAVFEPSGNTPATIVTTDSLGGHSVTIDVVKQTETILVAEASQTTVEEPGPDSSALFSYSHTVTAKYRLNDVEVFAASDVVAHYFDIVKTIEGTTETCYIDVEKTDIVLFSFDLRSALFNYSEAVYSCTGSGTKVTDLSLVYNYCYNIVPTGKTKFKVKQGTSVDVYKEDANDVEFERIEVRYQTMPPFENFTGSKTFLLKYVEAQPTQGTNSYTRSYAVYSKVNNLKSSCMTGRTDKSYMVSAPSQVQKTALYGSVTITTYPETYKLIREDTYKMSKKSDFYVPEPPVTNTNYETVYFPISLI